MHVLKKIYQIVKNYGIGFIFYRITYLLQKKSGIIKYKFPTKNWLEIDLKEFLIAECDFSQIIKNRTSKFFFDSKKFPQIEYYKNSIVTDAEDILQNKFRYFFNKRYSIGTQPDWFLNPISGKRANSEEHWSDVNFYNPNVGDIKFIWEPSRFAWAYTLVRAYAATEDEKYVKKFEKNETELIHHIDFSHIQALIDLLYS